MNVGSINSGLAQKVSQRLGRLASATQKVAAKLEEHPNAGQLQKSEQLLWRLGDGPIPMPQGAALIQQAVSLGNSVTFGQAVSQLNHAAPSEPAAADDTAEAPVEGASLDILA